MTAKEIAKLAVFEGKQIRKTIHDGEWYFSVIDVIGVLTNSSDPKDYWYRIKKREKIEKVELSTICRQLKLAVADGKKYATDCANTKGLFRIIQSIPSPKTEPFKQWLAQVGYERIQEIENPELAQERGINQTASLPQPAAPPIPTTAKYRRFAAPRPDPGWGQPLRPA